MTITLENLSFSYGQKPVLQDFCAVIEGPTLLSAPSGAGKTTLLYLLAGLLTPDSGGIHGLGPGVKTAVVFQEDRLLPQLTVEGNLRLVCPQAHRWELEMLLGRLGLEDVLAELPGALSGGMRRRVAVARALLFAGDFYLMDEPFQGLDGNTKARVLEVVAKATAGRPLLLISHDPSDAHALGARMLTLPGH